MIHNYVERRGAESHGSWSVGKGRAGVLVQLTAGFDQTRIAISPDDALRLADQLMELALKAMNGLSGQRGDRRSERSEEHTSELQSLMRISYAVFCLKKKNIHHKQDKLRSQTIMTCYTSYQ